MRSLNANTDWTQCSSALPLHIIPNLHPPARLLLVLILPADLLT